MRRIVIMGPPGSGKSTFARALGAKLGLPVFHLDQAYWRKGWVAAPAAEFDAEVARLAALPAWIIEGNYTRTLPPRLARADAVYFLDCRALLSLFRVVRRAFHHLGKTRDDMPAGCIERLDPAFFRYALNWNRRYRKRNLELLIGFDGPVHILRGVKITRFMESAGG